MEDNADTLSPSKRQKTGTKKPKAATANSKASNKTTSTRKTASASTGTKSKTNTVKAKAGATEKSTKTKIGLQRSARGEQISSEQRYRMIETAAYYVAEKRGFNSNPEDDWLVAENQIDQQLNAHI